MKINSLKSLSTGILALAISASLPSRAEAHHGLDFLTLQSYEIPGPLGAYLFTDFEWERSNGDDEFGIEPGLLFGLLPRTALEVQTRFSEEPGADWRYESVTPSLLIQLTPPDSKCPFRVAITAGYEFAEELGEAEDHHHEDEEEEEDGGGGHNHGTDGFEGRVILEYQTGDWLIGTNFTVDTDDQEDSFFGYSAGLRYRVCDGFATGVEAQGDFEEDSSHELIAGLYFEPMHSAVIKIGAGFGLTEHSPDFSLRTGLVWRF